MPGRVGTGQLCAETPPPTRSAFLARARWRSATRTRSTPNPPPVTRNPHDSFTSDSGGGRRRNTTALRISADTGTSSHGTPNSTTSSHDGRRISQASPKRRPDHGLASIRRNAKRAISAVPAASTATPTRLSTLPGHVDPNMTSAFAYSQTP